MRVRSMLAVAVVIALGCGASRVEGQAFDSLGRPRPLRAPPISSTTKSTTVRFCKHCPYRGPTAVRVVGTAGELLFVPPSDTSFDLLSDARVAAIDRADIADISFVKPSASAVTNGSSYPSAVFTITLTEKGTQEWLKRAAVRQGVRP